jgi:hypothetical protein
LHFTIYIKNYVGNYATFDGLVNGGNDIFKASITYCEKTIICKMFQKIEIEILTPKKIVIITTTLNRNGHQLNLSSKI